MYIILVMEPRIHHHEVNLITGSSQAEETCKQGCLLCEQETSEFTPNSSIKVFWVLLRRELYQSDMAHVNINSTTSMYS